MTAAAWLERLIAIADGTLDETRARLRELDARRVVDALMREVADRAALRDLPDQHVLVGFALTAPGGETLLGQLALDRDGVALAGRDAGAPQVRIRQELAELLRAVYGTDGEPHDATREVWIMDEPGAESDDPDDPWLRELRAATVAAGSVVAACSPYRADLGEIARRLGCEKWGSHFYTPHYERHLARHRDRRVRVLEIGVGGYEAPDRGGESLRMWKHFFRRGSIFGIDVFDKSELAEPRIATLRADQSDPESLAAAARSLGRIDVVVDDGSHISEHVITAFTTLFPLLADGGLYVVEDLQTSYWPGWNGGRRDLADSGTSVGFLKTLFDCLHHQDLMPGTSPGPAAAFARDVRALHLYHNLAFVEKGVNAEQTAPSWVPRAANDMDLVPKGSMRRVELAPRS